MINFKSLKVIKKLTLEQGDLYFLDPSTATIKRLTESESELKKKKPDQEKLILILLGAMLCDEKGELLKLTKEDYEEMPKSIFIEIVNFSQALAMGEKKS